MSSPLRIELRPSRALRAALLGLALAAGVSLWLSAAPRILLLGVPVLLALAWPRRGSAPEGRLVMRDDGTAVLELGAGEEREVAPVRLQRRGPLTVVELRAGERRVAFAFLPDTLDAAEARALRLWFARHAESPKGADAVASHV